jgi:hypothetical protein
MLYGGLKKENANCLAAQEAACFVHFLASRPHSFKSAIQSLVALTKLEAQPCK